MFSATSSSSSRRSSANEESDTAEDVEDDHVNKAVSLETRPADVRAISAMGAGRVMRILAAAVLIGVSVIAFTVWKTKGARVRKLKVKLGTDHFEFEGEDPLSDIAPLLDKFYELTQQGDGYNVAQQLDAIRERVRANYDALDEVTGQK